MRRPTICLALAGLPILYPFDASAQRRPRIQIPANVVAVKDLTYGRAGGHALKLDLYRPLRPGKKRLPAVLWIHGGGWRSKDKAEGALWLSELMKSGRYVCVSINYRLSGQAIWPAQIHDCKAAVRWLRANASRYGIEPRRIGVAGASAGGQLACLLGTSGGDRAFEGSAGSPGFGSRVSAVVDFFGVKDMARRSDPVGARGALFGGPILQKLEVARAACPERYISADDPPFLIFHGTADHVVPLEQSERFHAALRKAGVTSELVRIQGGGHGLRGHHRSMLPRMQRFFDRHLHAPLPSSGELKRLIGEALGEK